MINLRIKNKVLLASNLVLTEGQETTRLIADIASGSSTLTVDNISGFSIGKYILIGNFGEPNSEIIRIHTATAPTGSTITLNANTVFDHYSDTPVTMVQYDQVEYSKATTLAGAKTVLNTAAAINISADRIENGYVPITGDALTDAVYVFCRFKNSATTTYSDYSAGVLYSGHSYLSLHEILRKACADASVEIGGQYSQEDALLNDANDAIEEIAKLDWIFELVKNDTSVSLTENENSYALTGLTYTPKYTGTAQGIKRIKLGSVPLRPLDQDQMDDELENTVKTTLAAIVNIGATSITLTDSYEFADSGTVSLGAFTATYTTNTKATGVLSGISAATFTSSVANGSSVWQGISPGLPTKYTILAGNVVLNKPVDTDYVGYKLKFTYLKAMTRFTDFASVTEIPFTNEISRYVTAKIEQRKRNIDIADNLMNKFVAGVANNYEKYKLPTMDKQKYYYFFDETEE